MQINIRYNGERHANWRLPFTLNQGTTATKSAFAAHLHPQPGDNLTVSLAGDGKFTHTHTFDFPGYYCYLDLTGQSVH